MQSFADTLRLSTRRDDEQDWSPHTVDYDKFKDRLFSFAHRRTQIRNSVRRSPDGRLSEQALVAIMGPRSHRPPLPMSPPPMDYTQAGYLPFVDEEASVNEGDLFDAGSMSPRHTSTRRLTKRKIARWVSSAERNEVIVFLSWEMDKVAMLYNALWQNLSRRFEQEGCSSDLQREILELLAYCTINIITVRQSLIRYDAFVRTFGDPPLLQWYTKKMTKEHNRTSYRKILFHEELKALVEVFLNERRADHYAFSAQVKMFQRLQETTKHAELLSSMGHVVLRDTFIQTLRDYFLLGLVEDRLGLQPNYLTLRGTSLASEMHEICQWRKRDCEISPEISQSLSLSRLGTESRLSLQEYHGIFLNLFSGFLYCMNYYIVEPSSTKYANALGAPDNTSGLIIGMMPIAALISSIAYSVWTNRSFRLPLLLSSVMLMTGNIIYASAYKTGYVHVALAGRFMTGLGCPKVIIRRFMADTTPVSLRTGVNAGFGMAIAVGSAMGPAAAILLDNFDAEVEFPLFGKIYLNGMTGPGYFMAVLWAIFTLTLLISFREPDRSGLEEQRKLEAVKQRKPSILVGEGEVELEAQRPSRSEKNLRSVVSGDTCSLRADLSDEVVGHHAIDTTHPQTSVEQLRYFLDLITFPVQLCLSFLFCKTFTIEALVSATSSLTKNRYGWSIQEVGTLGCINGLLVLPLSILVGYLSLFYQDRVLMTALVSIGCFGMFLLIDMSDLLGAPTVYYNYSNFWLAVHPQRYVLGYLLAFCSIQSFEGVIGSALSKVIPTALASGTFNSGLLATLVDTLGRASGDVFIFVVGGINMRQLMNLLFIPSFSILLGCLAVIRKYYDILAV